MLYIKINAFKLYIWMYDYSFLVIIALLYYTSYQYLDAQRYCTTDGHNCIKRSLYLNYKKRVTKYICVREEHTTGATTQRK